MVNEEVKTKKPNNFDRLLEDYQSHMIHNSYTKGYDNKAYHMLTTTRAKAQTIDAPIIKEFEFQGKTHQHKVDFDFFGSADSKILAAFFHGGPGSGMALKHRWYWPAKQPDAILKQHSPEISDYASSYLLFQQPAAKFTYDTENYEPDANLQHLDTGLLVDSLKVAHTALKAQGIKNERIAATGLSFGATLAVLFADKYPELTDGLGLYGLFYGTAKDVQWIFQGAHEKYSPEFTNDFKKFSIKHGGEKENFVQSFSYLFKHPDQQVQREALFHYYKMELHTEEKVVLKNEEFDLWKNPNAPGLFEQKRLRAATMIHFAENNFWLDEQYGILPAIENIAKNNIPVVLGLSGKDFLLPPEKRNLLCAADAFKEMKPENFNLIYNGDTAHLSTAQIVSGNHNLRHMIMAKNGTYDRFNI